MKRANDLEPIDGLPEPSLVRQLDVSCLNITGGVRIRLQRNAGDMAGGRQEPALSPPLALLLLRLRLRLPVLQDAHEASWGCRACQHAGKEELGAPRASSARRWKSGKPDNEAT